MGSGYYVNGQKLRYKEMKPLFNKYPNASAEYSIYSRKATVSAVMFLGSLISEGIGLAVYKNNRKLSHILFNGGVALQLIALPISVSGRNHLHRSIRLYNINVMSY